MFDYLLEIRILEQLSKSVEKYIDFINHNGFFAIVSIFSRPKLVHLLFKILGLIFRPGSSMGSALVIQEAYIC